MQIYIKNMNIVNFLLAVRRILNLSPMKKVLRELKKRNVRLKDLHALELFGGSGASHTMDYASQVATLEMWEINPKQEKALKQNLPMAKVKIVDTYKEIKKTSKKYNLIIIDAPVTAFGEYCEHFDLFPDVFHIVMDATIIILNVMPEPDNFASKLYPEIFNEEHLARRKVFYKTEHPKKLSFDVILQTYKKLILTNGFNLEWYFFHRRNYLYYLVLKIKKQ